MGALGGGGGTSGGGGGGPAAALRDDCSHWFVSTVASAACRKLRGADLDLSAAVAYSCPACSDLIAWSTATRLITSCRSRSPAPAEPADEPTESKIDDPAAELAGGGGATRRPAAQAASAALNSGRHRGRSTASALPPPRHDSDSVAELEPPYLCRGGVRCRCCRSTGWLSAMLLRKVTPPESKTVD